MVEGATPTSTSQAPSEQRAPTLDLPPIAKSPRDWQVPPNLANYEQARVAFSWADARAQLAGLPDGRGLNIAHEAVGCTSPLSARSNTALCFVTVTSLGERGVETVFGVIYPPQVAIVGFGKVVERPWAEGGGLYARPVVTATLSGDHRATDGHRGGLFLSAIDRLLQEPEKL